MNYRNKVDIMADILNVAKGNAKRTQIMFQANLSYKVLKRHLDEAVAASLLRYEDKMERYALTKKGLEFLEVYKEYSRTVRMLEKRLDLVRNKRKTLEQLCEGKTT